MTINQLRQEYDREYKIGPTKLAPLYFAEEAWMSDKAPPATMRPLQFRTLLSLNKYVHGWKSEGHERITIDVDVLIGLLDIAISHRGTPP